MVVSVPAKTGFSGVRHRLLIGAFLLVVLLVVSLFVCVLVLNRDSRSEGNKSGSSGLSPPYLLLPPVTPPSSPTPPSPLPPESRVQVKTENELRDAINNLPMWGSAIITLTADITLTEHTLTIPAYKNVTLTSSKASGFYRLIGAVDVAGWSDLYVITVEGRGVLRLDGIIVTRVKGSVGGGVNVLENGLFIMFGGEVLGHSAVFDQGVFVFPSMAGSCGGGVFNSGTFEMYGGKISNNHAWGAGGGVYIDGQVSFASFCMYGGVISGNSASYDGGGVSVPQTGRFELFGGVISGNTAGKGSGGGVDNSGVFEMHSGVVSGNTAAALGGGVVTGSGGVFSMYGGTISSNRADRGGGVCNSVVSNGVFNRLGGEIFGNTANTGKDVYELQERYNP